MLIGTEMLLLHAVVEVEYVFPSEILQLGSNSLGQVLVVTHPLMRDAR